MWQRSWIPRTQDARNKKCGKFNFPSSLPPTIRAAAAVVMMSVGKTLKSPPFSSLRLSKETRCSSSMWDMKKQQIKARERDLVKISNSQKWKVFLTSPVCCVWKLTQNPSPKSPSSRFSSPSPSRKSTTLLFAEHRYPHEITNSYVTAIIRLPIKFQKKLSFGVLGTSLAPETCATLFSASRRNDNLWARCRQKSRN